MKKAIFFLSAIVSVSAFADYKLSKSGDVVTCFGADNQVITLNAKRTTIKYSVEGESLGARKIERKTDNKRNKATYSTEELTLTLSDKGDVFQYDGGDVEEVDCN